MNTNNQLVAVSIICMIVMNFAAADSSLVHSMVTFQPNQDSRFIALANDGITNIEWQTYAGSIPNEAIQGGQESDGSPLYICRASDKDGIHPGKVVEKNHCNIGWGGLEQEFSKFELIINKASC